MNSLLQSKEKSERTLYTRQKQFMNRIPAKNLSFLMKEERSKLNRTKEIKKREKKVHKRKRTVSEADQDVSPLSEDAVHV